PYAMAQHHGIALSGAQVEAHDRGASQVRPRQGVGMNIERAMTIDGWMEKHDLEWLAEKASQHQTIAEVGCWMGRSTRALADNTPGKVWAVDHWKGSEEHQGSFKDNADNPDWCFNLFKQNLHDLIGTKVVPLRNSSVNVAYAFSSIGMKLDMVFIDASHDYD